MYYTVYYSFMIKILVWFQRENYVQVADCYHTFLESFKRLYIKENLESYLKKNVTLL